MAAICTKKECNMDAPGHCPNSESVPPPPSPPGPPKGKKWFAFSNYACLSVVRLSSIHHRCRRGINAHCAMTFNGPDGSSRTFDQVQVHHALVPHAMDKPHECGGI